MADNLTRVQRSYCMSRVKRRDTDLERLVRSELHRRGLRFRTHAKDLPGTPDIVFRTAHVAVFVDGDFWHGYRLPVWESTISQFWRNKLRDNRERDQRNFRRLRAGGWRVVRVWQREIKRDLNGSVAKIIDCVTAQRAERGIQVSRGRMTVEAKSLQLVIERPSESSRWELDI